MKLIDLIGKKFSKLTVIEKVPRAPNVNRTFWLCECECGNRAIVDGQGLKRGSTKSCGCMKSIWCATAATRHGAKGTTEYYIWKGMRQRCLNDKSHAWNDYGGRGIKICNRWLESFESFLEDMGCRPSDKHTLDRIDNDGNYEKSNCRWATDIEQQNNTRKNRFLEAFGLKLSINEWERRTGIDNRVIHKRLRRGWNAERILTTPTKKVPIVTVDI